MSDPIPVAVERKLKSETVGGFVDAYLNSLNDTDLQYLLEQEEKAIRNVSRFYSVGHEDYIEFDTRVMEARREILRIQSILKKRKTGTSAQPPDISATQPANPTNVVPHNSELSLPKKQKKPKAQD